MFLAELKRKKSVKRKRPRLHLSAAQRLVNSQEADGHFDAFNLSFELARVWEKLMPMASMPVGGTATAKNETAIDCLYSAPAVEELSADPLYATVFVVRLFELYAESLSCTTDSKRRDQILEWFGSGSILRGRWFSSAENWLVSKNLDWRVTHSKAAEDVAKKWFDTGTKCRHTGIFIDNDQLLFKKKELGEKFAASHIESLKRDEEWICCTSADIHLVHWKKAVAIAWSMGGEGGAYPVRFGTDEKVMVKRCTAVGDVLAEEVTKIIGLRSAPARFISQASSEYRDAKEALISAKPDEPEIGRSIQLMLEKMQADGHPLMLMKFISGEPLTGHLGSQLLRNGAKEEFHDVIKALGHSIAFDCLMNNWDRFPALSVWPRKGNLENVIVSENSRKGSCKYEVVFIDNSVKFMPATKDQLEYFCALAFFVKEVGSMHINCKGSGVGTPTDGLQRIREAIRRQVPLWTGEKHKDAEIYQRFLQKPESVSSVELDNITIRLLVEGLSEVFSKAKKFRAEFVAKRTELVSMCRRLFIELDSNQYGKFIGRVEGCLDFVCECLQVVENNWKR